MSLVLRFHGKKTSKCHQRYLFTVKLKSSSTRAFPKEILFYLSLVIVRASASTFGIFIKRFYSRLKNSIFSFFFFSSFFINAFDILCQWRIIFKRDSILPTSSSSSSSSIPFIRCWRRCWILLKIFFSSHFLRVVFLITRPVIRFWWPDRNWKWRR